MTRKYYDVLTTREKKCCHSKATNKSNECAERGSKFSEPKIPYVYTCLNQLTFN
uniref:Uncharacterized protein n=1 Tax=Arundo donax TaxID=35708 RepID=A0A0A9B251_ARUDO